MASWWARVRALFHRTAIDRDLRDELDAHLQMEIDARLEGGMPAEQARTAALRAVGSAPSIRESAAEAWRLGAGEVLVRDVRYAARLMRRSPGFSITAIAIMAIGIGVTAATFTLLDRVLLRPLPFAQPHRLVLLHEARLANGVPRTPTSAPNYLDWKAASSSFENMGAYISILFPLNLSGRGEPQRLDSAMLTGEMFEVLGVPPIAGRLLAPADDRSGAPDVVLIGERLAVALFGAAANAVGQTVRLDDQPVAIAGVMPASFAFPIREVQIWRPLRVTPPMVSARSNHFLFVIGRLRPGVTLDRARGDLAVIAERLQLAYPQDNAGTTIVAVDLRDLLSPQSRLLVVAIFAASICLLLIACTNLANLLVARAIARRREMAVRMALGAGRRRIVRQLLTENALFGVLGGALGLILASVGVDLFARLVPNGLPVDGVLRVDLRTGAFAALLVLVTCVVFGLGPAMRTWRTADLQVLRTRATPRGSRMRGALVFAEVAGSVVLLIAAALLVKSLWRVQAIDPGFRTDGVITARTALPMPKYARPDARASFYERVLAAARAQPGVVAAAYTSYHPMELGSGRMPVTSPGTVDDPLTAPEAIIHFVTPGFFETLRIPLRQGRDFTDRDEPGAPFVAIVSQRLAERLWPGRDPIGQRVVAARAERVVIGVAAEIAVRQVEGASDPQIYFPAQQLGSLSPYYAPKDVLIRTAGNAMTLASTVEKMVHAVEPSQAVSAVRPLAEIVAAQAAPRRDQAAILVAIAALAFLLAVIGLHGVLSYAVSSRTQEIGVRVALGADRRDILGLFLRQGLLMGALGVAAAIPLAYVTARAMRALLFGVAPGDPAIYLGSAAAALLVTLLASAAPSLRAARIDPAATIRAD
jgi:predicted permease